MPAMLRRRRILVAALVVGLAAAAASAAARPYLHGISFVIRAADMQGMPQRVAGLDTVSIRERELQIPLAAGVTLRARAYEPETEIERTAVLVTGLHPAGLDEPRLVGLARDLAESGVAVVTPDIPELSQFAITPGIVDAIEQVAHALSRDSHFAPDGRVGLMGISFSGGLSVVAAGRTSIRDRIAYVFAFGGHGDLPRVLRYLCGQPSEAGLPPPHDYGVAVMLLGLADQLVPPEQAGPLREAVRQFLWASHLDRVDKPEADRVFAELRALAATLPEPSSTLLGYVNDRDVVHLGARLLPVIGHLGDAPALSPARSPSPAAPVFLLHGSADNVIPTSESRLLADHLGEQTDVHLVISELITHAEVDRPPRAGEVLTLARFWGDLLGR
jgi:dienelactone hydrolase